MYRRYTEFNELHNKTRKKYAIVNTFEFPKKKAIGNRVCFLLLYLQVTTNTSSARLHDESLIACTAIHYTGTLLYFLRRIRDLLKSVEKSYKYTLGTL